MHANTIQEHDRLAAEAREITRGWRNTDPMRDEEQVRVALEHAGTDPAEMPALLPYVIDECLASGLLLGGEEVQRVGLQTARASAVERMYR